MMVLSQIFKSYRHNLAIIRNINRESAKQLKLAGTEFYVEEKDYAKTELKTK